MAAESCRKPKQWGGVENLPRLIQPCRKRLIHIHSGTSVHPLAKEGKSPVNRIRQDSSQFESRDESITRRRGGIRRILCRIVLAIFAALMISSSASAGQLIYSHQFAQNVTYCLADPQYDDWLSFRASLPAAGVKSITISGSQDPVGRTCSDPVNA